MKQRFDGEDEVVQQRPLPHDLDMSVPWILLLFFQVNPSKEDSQEKHLQKQYSWAKELHNHLNLQMNNQICENGIVPAR